MDDFTADAVVSQLLYLDAQDPTKVGLSCVFCCHARVTAHACSACAISTRSESGACLPRVRGALCGADSPFLSYRRPFSLDAPQDIKLFINSPGGSVTAGMGIYDAMQMCRCDVSTVCFGLAASMGAFLLAAGAKGKRMSMPNARIMIHQPLGGASGQAVDIEIQAREIMYHKGNLNRLLAYHTGRPVEQVDEDTDRDRYMSPLEAKQYGLIDVVIGGDDAGLKVDSDPKDFLKTRSAYVSWGDDGSDSGDRASRFGPSRIKTTDLPTVAK